MENHISSLTFSGLCDLNFFLFVYARKGEIKLGNFFFKEEEEQLHALTQAKFKTVYRAGNVRV